ncbi:MAG: exo-alpha-sialidase [Bacteroidaceae bacterium]|nr:exo-alpha-sialidase [Bacteroidaceae bacterium]
MTKRHSQIMATLLMLLCSSVAWCEVPFRVTTVTKDGFAADTEWYTMAIGSSGLFISDNADKEFIAVKSNRSELADADLWCFAGDEKSGYKIYNKQAGPGKVLAAPTKMSGDAGSKAYVVLKEDGASAYSTMWTFAPSKDLGGNVEAYYLAPKGASKNIVNNRGGKLAFWTTGADTGSSVVIAICRNEVKIDALNGTFTTGNAAGTWFSKWVSNDKQTPVTLSSSANNMKNVGNDIACYTGSANSATYTISAPKGYRIEAIKLGKAIKDATADNIKIEYKGTALPLDNTLSYTADENPEQSISVTLSDSKNSGVILKEMTVTVVRYFEKPEPHFELFPTPTSEAIPYRIPAITTTASGDLLAVADYRHCRYDIGNGRIDLHGRISKDNGKTWGDIFTIIEGDGKLVDNNRNLSLSAGYGDPAIVADRESNRVLMLCVCGYQVFFYSTREIPNQVARLYSEDGGVTWSKPEVITEQFYTPFDNSNVGPIRSMFIGSGRIFQSRLTKVGDYYRLYAAMLARDKDGTFCNFVVYSDDFGGQWKVLGSTDKGAIPHSGDEPKTEELPDGSILISSRCGGGRYYNIFRFEDAEAATGSWGEMAFSGAKNNGVTALNNSCNGEVMILPAVRNSDGKQLYLALQSLPFGSGRSNVGIYYKELDDYNDFLTPAHFAKDWDGSYRSSITGSAYSTMTLQADGALAFIYEEDTYGTSGGGYTIAYKSYTIEKITDGKYSLDKNENRALYLYKNVIAPLTAK